MLSEAGTYTGSQGPKVTKAEVPIKIVYQDCYCFGFAKGWVWPLGMYSLMYSYKNSSDGSRELSSQSRVSESCCWRKTRFVSVWWWKRFDVLGSFRKCDPAARRGW